MLIRELFGEFRGVMMICCSQQLRVKSRTQLRFGKNQIKASKVHFQEMLSPLRQQLDSFPTLLKSKPMGLSWAKKAVIYPFG